jgi:hypothetical protein
MRSYSGYWVGGETLLRKEITMQFRTKLALTVLGGIFAVLAVMLSIALLRGGGTPADKDNSDVESNTARVVDIAQPAWTPARTA